MERLPLGKECTQCGTWELYEDYHREKLGRGGRRSKCKPCDAERQRTPEAKTYQLEWQRRNKDKISEYNRRWRTKYPERAKANKDRFKDRNPDYHREYDAKKYSEHRDEIIARAADYAKRNPEGNRLRNAQRRGSYGVVSTPQWLAMLAAFKYRCACCGSENSIEIDHVIPLSLGGLHVIENLQPLCTSCNRRKLAKFEDYRWWTAVNPAQFCSRGPAWVKSRNY